MATKKDTHGFVIGDSNSLHEGVDYPGGDFSESLKMSNLENVTIRNSTIGSGHEDCLDVNRGRHLLLDDVRFMAGGAKQAITCKGGFQNMSLHDCKFFGRPRNGYIVLGQYSDHNFCGKGMTKYFKLGLLKTIQTELVDCEFEYKDIPTVTVWFADGPRFVNCKGKVKRWGWMFNAQVVWTYFTVRKIQQGITFGKNGRNDCCLQNIR